ncbi:hypothetical protein Rhe02_28030 [Rhizocola hellebori]|uniref:Serine protease n=2 Tax=Rhizocola hellebori TaxID=1392758 RepID=A0A8J3VG56_9ACTN|nr:hypothetical protein Rhe02_28030 [Rhizocola hellebori]
MKRTLTVSGLAALLIVISAAPVWPAQAPSKLCTAPAPVSSAELPENAEAQADQRNRAVNDEVEATFGVGAIKERIADQLRRGLIGVVADPITGNSTVVATPEFRAVRGLTTAKLMIGCHPAAALIDADDVLVSRAWHPQAAQATFSFSLHANDSRFHVSFDPRFAAAAAALSAVLGDRAVVTVSETGRTGRLNDGEPHFGGAGIRNGYNSSLSSNTCTAGFTVRRNADGQRGGFTAGHCFANGNILYSSTQLWGEAWGKVNFPAYDMIGIKSWSETYDNVIHTDNCCPVKRDVIGRDPAVVGDLVCFSGMVSKALCSIQVTSTNGYFCDQYGCTGGLIEAIRGGGVIVRPGDSGAPIYTRYGSNSALATGMVIAAAGGGTIAYGEHIGVIESYFNVSVLTS